MTLELVVGPVRSGKLGVVLEALRRRPARRARSRCCSCLRRSSATRSNATPAGAGALLGGEVVTLDTLVERVLGGRDEVASEALDRVLRRRIGQRARCGSRAAPGGARLRSRAPGAGVRPRRRRAGRARRRSRRRTHAWRLRTRPTRQASPQTGRARRGAARLAGGGAARERALRLGRRAGARVRLRRPLTRAAAPPRCPLGAAASSCWRCPTSPGGRCSGRSTSPSSGSPRGPTACEELRAAAYGAPASIVALARGAFSARSEARPRGRRRSAARRGRGQRWRGGTRSPRRSAGSCGCGLAPDDVLVVAPDGYDCEPLGDRARARRGRRRGRHQRAPHEPARRPGAARALPRCLVGWRSGRRVRLAAPRRLDLGRVARARLRGSPARTQHHRRRTCRARAADLPSRRAQSRS